MRRHDRSVASPSILFVIVCFLSTLGLPTGAATLSVATGAVAIADDGDCSLREAIHNAGSTGAWHLARR